MIRVSNDLAGVSLAGQYRLEQFLGGDEAAVWYLTMSRSGERAAIKIMPEEPASAASQLGAWRATRLLSHSNLLPMFDCGRAESPAGPVLWAVFEYPDDNLASALERGGLDGAEAKETLSACLEALRYIHGRGMVHGAIDAQHILAVGERVKLASDSLRPASTAECQPEDDLRALLRLLGTPSDPEAQPLPVPPPLAPAPAPAPPPELVVAPVAAEAAWRKLPNWMYGALAGLVIAVALPFALKPSNPSRSVADPPSQAAPPKTAPVLPPEPARASEPAAPRREQTRDVWRVVAYTYNRYRDAEKRARNINARWPGLHASVFAPKGKDRPPYFVALGGRMTRAEAMNLRHVARAKGLPRDTFVRNYSD